MYKKTAKKLLKFIQKSPTAFQAVEEMSQRLQKEGFKELKEEKHWDLKAGGNYFVTRNHSAVIAFSIPKKPAWKFHIMASHSDSPALKIKENPEMEVEKAYIKLNVERYGGMLLAPWFDRPLSVAGRLIVRKNGEIQEKLVAVDKDLLVIPNLAIHMNREVNDGYKYNVQKDMLPLYSDYDGKGSFMKLMAAEADVAEEDILGHDLFYMTGLRERSGVRMRNLSLRRDWMIFSVHLHLWRDFCVESARKVLRCIACWIMRKWAALRNRGLRLLS